MWLRKWSGHLPFRPLHRNQRCKAGGSSESVFFAVYFNEFQCSWAWPERDALWECLVPALVVFNALWIFVVIMLLNMELFSTVTRQSVYVPSKNHKQPVTPVVYLNRVASVWNLLYEVTHLALYYFMPHCWMTVTLTGKWNYFIVQQTSSRDTFAQCSTVKPLSFARIASQYMPAHYDASTHSQVPNQRLPTGGSRTHGGPKQDFRGSEMRLTRVRVVQYVLGRYIFQNRRDLWKLACAITKKNINQPSYAS